MASAIPLHQLTATAELPDSLMVLESPGHWRISTSEALECISPDVWRFLGGWSIRTGKSVLELLSPLVIRWDDIPCQAATEWRKAIRLEGQLPCGLFGCILSDGSSHT